MRDQPRKMGNRNGKARQMIHPPRDLNSLLLDSAEDIWIKRFRQHLHKIERFDLEAMLDFVIKGKHIEASQDPKLRQPAKHPKQQQREVGKSHQQPEHRTDRRQLLTEICSDFFSENAPNPIPLTNQVLREQICQALADLQAKPKDDSLLLEAADLVKLATRDFKVWKGGLDAAYSKFLATYSTSFSDAILSIL